MSYFDTLKNWILAPAEPLTSFPINTTNSQLNPDPLQANRHYVRLRLARMFLKYQQTWFQSWYPAVQSFVRFQFGDQTVEIPNVADAKRIKLEPVSGQDLIVKNVPLSPIVPFKGGLIEVSAGLLAIKGTNGLQNFIGVLTGFANVLQTPQLSGVLKIAEPLVNGIQVLLNSAYDHMHLGYFDSFSAGQLRDGYIAIIRSPQGELDRTKLVVVDDELHVTTGAGATRPFTECDYMLLRTEVFDSRDDWENLTFISEPWSEVLNAFSAQGPDWEKLAAARYRAVLLRLNQANELTRTDRIRIGRELQSQFEGLRQQFSVNAAVAGELPTFADLARRAVPPSAVAHEREPTIEELLAQV